VGARRSGVGIALAGPVYGHALVYAELKAWMIKATKAMVDTMGHYARPHVLRLLMHGEQGWQPAGSARDLSSVRIALTDEALTRGVNRRLAYRSEIMMSRPPFIAFFPFIRGRRWYTAKISGCVCNRMCQWK
jgi:hypothetical protein